MAITGSVCGLNPSFSFSVLVFMTPGVSSRNKLATDGSSINAYIVFVMAGSADKATASNGYIMDGHCIRVDSLSGAKHHDHKLAVFIGNLPFGTVHCV